MNEKRTAAVRGILADLVRSGRQPDSEDDPLVEAEGIVESAAIATIILGRPMGAGKWRASEDSRTLVYTTCGMIGEMRWRAETYPDEVDAVVDFYTAEAFGILDPEYEGSGYREVTP